MLLYYFCHIFSFCSSDTAAVTQATITLVNQDNPERSISKGSIFWVKNLGPCIFMYVSGYYFSTLLPPFN